MSLLTLDVDESAAIITLNDARRRNIISLPLVDELEAAFADIEAQEDIRAVIITGNGPAFCAGADLADLESASKGDVDGLQRIYQGFLRVANCPLPTIAAVNGPAVGAGMNLALACDMRVAAESAVFDCRFLDLGLHPGGGHTWMLNRAVGWQASVAMLLLGQQLSGSEAASHNLAWQCVADDELLPTCIEIAHRAKRFPRELLVTTGRTLHETTTKNDHSSAVELEYVRQVASMHEPEFVAFLQRMKKKISAGSKNQE